MTGTEFDQAAASLVRAATQNGKSQMQNAVLRWLTANRGEVSVAVVEALIAHMARELEAE